MNILAFESSCDETACAVVACEDGRLSIKSNIVASQIETHRLYGGVVPEIASRAHVEVISKITYEALEAAKLSLSDVDLIAVTANPGLIGALLVAVNFAKSLAVANGIPLVAVDHIKGHIAASYIGEDTPKPPFLALAVSGGHTSIYKVESYTKMVTVGSTRDDAIGESFDKIGRLIGIPYPAGRGFDALAREGFEMLVGTEGDYLKRYSESEEYKKGDMALPSPAVKDSSYDFSFSGLKTAAINLLHRYEQRGEEIDRARFAARYTYESVFAVQKKLRAALTAYDGLDLVVAGGVAANSHLRHALSLLCAELGRKIFIPHPSLCGDNGAMIGAQGYYEFAAGRLADESLNASAMDSQ